MVDPYDKLRAWSLTALYFALALFMLTLVLATLGLWQALMKAGNTAAILWALNGAALVTSVLCAGAGARGLRALMRKERFPGPAWIAIAMVAAVMTIAGAVFEGF